MSDELKKCSCCGTDGWRAPDGMIRCDDPDCHNYLYYWEVEEWQQRPLEDALQAKLEKREQNITDWIEKYYAVEEERDEYHKRLTSAIDLLETVRNLYPMEFPEDEFAEITEGLEEYE